MMKYFYIIKTFFLELVILSQMRRKVEDSARPSINQTTEDKYQHTALFFLIRSVMEDSLQARNHCVWINSKQTKKSSTKIKISVHKNVEIVNNR